jgi:hypothetical protein
VSFPWAASTSTACSSSSIGSNREAASRIVLDHLVGLGLL